MEDIKKEFEEKFIFNDGWEINDEFGSMKINSQDWQRGAYPKEVWSWIESKIKDAKEEGFQAGCDFTCKQYKEGE